MIKRWLSICVSCGLALAAVSCGDDDDADEDKVVIPIAGSTAPPPVEQSGTATGNDVEGDEPGTSSNEASGTMTTPGAAPGAGMMSGSSTPNPGSVPPPPPPPLPAF